MNGNNFRKHFEELLKPSTEQPTGKGFVTPPEDYRDMFNRLIGESTLAPSPQPTQTALLEPPRLAPTPEPTPYDLSVLDEVAQYEEPPVAVEPEPEVLQPEPVYGGLPEDIREPERRKFPSAFVARPEPGIWEKIKQTVWPDYKYGRITPTGLTEPQEYLLKAMNLPMNIFTSFAGGRALGADKLLWYGIGKNVPETGQKGIEETIAELSPYELGYTQGIRGLSRFIGEIQTASKLLRGFGWKTPRGKTYLARLGKNVPPWMTTGMIDGLVEGITEEKGIEETVVDSLKRSLVRGLEASVITGLEWGGAKTLDWAFKKFPGFRMGWQRWVKGKKPPEVRAARAEANAALEYWKKTGDRSQWDKLYREKYSFGMRAEPRAKPIPAEKVKVKEFGKFPLARPRVAEKPHIRPVQPITPTKVAPITPKAPAEKAVSKIMPEHRLTPEGRLIIESDIGEVQIPEKMLTGKYSEDLETVFYYGNFQSDVPQPNLERSLSVGDTIKYKDHTMMIMSFGWRDVTGLSEEAIEAIQTSPNAMPTVGEWKAAEVRLKKMKRGIAEREKAKLAKPPAKEAWEMTAAEFETAMDTKWKVGKKYFDKPKQLKNIQREVIQDALEQGKPIPRSVLEEYKKEIRYEEEAITEPTTSLEVEPKKAGELVPESTGQLDPTNPEEALKIIGRHNSWLAEGGGEYPAVGGIYETKWDKETGEHIVASVEYTPEQIDTAYRTVQKPIPSPMPDTELFVMPGKEAQMQAVAQKMQKVRGGVSKKTRKAKLTKPAGLPKAKTSQADYIKAIYKATAKETTRYAINGVKVEGDTIIATDGRRLFWAKGKWGKDGLYLDAASLKNGLLGKLTKEDKNLRFPKWRDIVPDVSGEKPIYVESERAWSDVRRAAILTTEESSGITIIANKDGSLGFAAASPEVGHVEINVNPDGKILGAVNPQFLLDAIRFHAIRGNDSFEFYFPDWRRPILTKSFDGKTSTITMPINIEIETPSEAIKKAISEGPVTKPPEVKPSAPSGQAMAAAAREKYGPVESSEKQARRDAERAGKVKARETSPREAFKDVPTRETLNALDEVLKIASPAHRGEVSRRAGRLTRMNLGELAHKAEVTQKTLNEFKKKFYLMSREDVLDFIDRTETGRRQKTAKLELAAMKLRKALAERRKAVQDLGKGKLEQFFEYYFPHIWKNPKRAQSIIAKIMGKKPLAGPKAFLKQRIIMTVKEGVGYGLEPVSWNPVELVLLKIHEMDRYLMAQNLIKDLKEWGLVKFVYARSKSPEGYIRINDNAFVVFMPPEMTVKEAYDSMLVEKLMNFAETLGIDAKRFVSIGGRGRWGYAQGDNLVRTKLGGPESVLVHEIGHILGNRYGLYEWMLRKKEGKWVTITKGEKKGQQKFVPTRESVEHRKLINDEWRALADKRFEALEATPGFKRYVRKGEEKEAVLLEALLHAPEMMEGVAPNVTKLFKKFLNDHAELRPVLDIKPSVVLGASEAKMKVPGITKLGQYYAPEQAAKIINNYLSPGLRNNDNLLVAGVYDAFRQTANTLNQANLSLSLFHVLNVTTDVINSYIGLGLRRITGIPGQRLRGFGSILTAPVGPAVNIFRGHNLQKAYRQEIDKIQDPQVREMVTAIVMAGGRASLDPFYYNQAIKQLFKNFSDLYSGKMREKLGATLQLPYHIFGTILEIAAKPIMQWTVPKGKFGLFSLLAESEIKRFRAGQITREQLHERLTQSWDNVDNRMGQLVYDNLFWNRTLKDVLMLTLRSVGWNLGSLREYGGVPVDILTTVGRVKRGDVWLSNKMGYALGAIINYAILGAVITYLLTGDRPRELRDYFFPRTGKKNPDGSDERLSLPTYAKDWYAYTVRLPQTIHNKLHPIWAMIGGMATNRDFWGTEIRHKDDPVMQQIKDVIEFMAKQYIPFSVRNYLKMQKAGNPPARAGITSVLGIVSAPSYISQTPSQKLMYKYIAGKIPQGARTKEQFDKAQKKKNIIVKRRADMALAQNEIDFVKSLRPEEQVKLVKRIKSAPFADAFARLSLSEAINVYTIASKDERRQVRALLTLKALRSKEVKLEEMDMLIELGVFSKKKKD